MEDTTTGTSTTGTITPPASTAASAGASGTIAPAERPTFAQAFASDAALQTPEAQAQPEAATTLPAETTDPNALHTSTDKTPPQETWPKILENARTKAKAEAVAEFDRDFGWAKSTPRETIQEWSGIAQLMSSDPAQFLEKYFAEAATHPTFGPQVKSWAARSLATRVPKADTMPEPDVQIVDAGGQVTGLTYSDKQLAARDEWRERQFMEKVDQRVKPFEQEREAKQRTERETAHRAELETVADRGLARIGKILGGDQALYEHVSALIDTGMDPIDAALQVRETHIVPKLDGDAQKKVLDTLTTKAAARGMNPASASPATSHRPRSLTDSSLRW